MYAWFLAFKYLISRLITLLALLAVTISVAVLIIVVSVMEGFRTELAQRIRGTTSDIKVESTMFIGLSDPERVEELIRKVPGVAGTAPVVETFALYNPGRERATAHQPLDQLLIAYDLENELSRRDFERTLAALGDEPEVGRLTAMGVSRLIGPLKEFYRVQPRTVEGLFSREWIQRDIWRPWQKHFGRPVPEFESAPAPIAVGIETLYRVGLLPGDVIWLTSFSPDVREPVERPFLVAGYFKTGLYEVDANAMVLRLEDAEDFLQLRNEEGELRVSGIRVDVEEAYAGPEALLGLREAIEDTLNEAGVLFVDVETWREARAALLDAVKVEKVIVSIILGVVILFAGFMIFIILTVQVVEKARDIGVLQSLGATASGVAVIYFLVGSSLCLLGMLLGTAYGVAISLSVNTILRWFRILTGMELFPEDIYYLDRIPVVFRAEDLAFIIATTVFASLLASVVPALRAARKSPVEGLRHG